MLCLICASKTEYYFSKSYTEHPFDLFMRDVGVVDYYRCSNCGFVLSKTHVDLDPDHWAKLNSDCHHYFEDPRAEKKGNQPPYLEQALMLMLLGRNGIVNLEDMIDYAAGYGTLSRLLSKYFRIQLSIFDPYVQAKDNPNYIHENDLRTYKLVISSALFEHVLRRDDLDRVNALVDSDGCLLFHTVVCENIPRDPEWFYLRPPVHTAFHTNRSMEILMKQWGYKSSLYCPQSKCWILFRNVDSNLADKVKNLNEEVQSDWLYYKDGFVDYWKGF